jgi:hypothetical protein
MPHTLDDDIRELELYAENTGGLYDHKLKILRIMASRIQHKRYERAGVLSLWRAWLKRAAKEYQREIEKRPFKAAAIDKLAAKLATEFEERIRSGEALGLEVSR